MEHKIGEIFEYNGEWYQCLENNSHCCEYCDFGELGDCDNIACGSGERNDYKEVCFKKLEKFGEPIIYMNRTFQRLKSLDDNICKYCYFKNQACNPQLCGEVFFLVEIKKVIKDMGEEKDIKPYDKYFSNGTVSNTDNLPKSNLKPFDVEAAKAGKPVCTRDGRNVRIIAFDAKRKDEKNIIALVPSKDYPGFEDLIAYPNNGNYYGGHENDGDLMILPQKKEGWAKVRKDINLYDTKEEADRKMIGNDEYVTAKVCWEE